MSTSVAVEDILSATLFVPVRSVFHAGCVRPLHSRQWVVGADGHHEHGAAPWHVAGVLGAGLDPRNRVHRGDVRSEDVDRRRRPHATIALCPITQAARQPH
jgi:hypothetical protein